MAEGECLKLQTLHKRRGEEERAPQRGDRLALRSGMGVCEAGDPAGDGTAAREFRQRAGPRGGGAAEPAGEGSEGADQGAVEDVLGEDVLSGDIRGEEGQGRVRLTSGRSGLR